MRECDERDAAMQRFATLNAIDTNVPATTADDVGCFIRELVRRRALKVSRFSRDGRERKHSLLVEHVQRERRDPRLDARAFFFSSFSSLLLTERLSRSFREIRPLHSTRSSNSISRVEGFILSHRYLSTVSTC